MNDINDLKYSNDAECARYYYYEDVNEINLFVEDEGKEFEYETIFKRLLKEDYKIETIFGVGGKIEVINAFKEFGRNSKSNPNKKNFYLVDGDFDRYINKNEMIDDPCFLYLKTYNIESYLVDEEISNSYVKGKLRCLDNDLKRRFDFQKWKDKIVNQASKLFFTYAFLKKYHPEEENVSRKPALFLNSNTGFEREDGAFDKYMDSLRNKYSDIDEKINEIKLSYEIINGDDYFNLICGKFLMTSLCWYIRAVTYKKFNHDDFRTMLVNGFDVTKLNYVRNKILELVA